jgi:hypothetical protein
MAAPSYTEDLTDIATGDEASGWIEFAGTSGFDDQGVPVYEDADYPYIQGSFAVTQSCSKSKTLGSLGFDYASTISLPTDGAFLVWQSFSSPFAIDDYVGTSTTFAGMMVLIGDDVSNFEVWNVGGKDKTPMPYGGFQCHAVNTTVAADNTSNGTKTIDRYVGAAIALTAYPSKGNPHQVDVMRFGRCSAIFEFGEALNYATIPGFATENDNQINRWGLIQETAGGYLWQGRIQLGSVSNLVDFRDSNRTIFIKWTPKVTANFNLIEILNTDSNIEMTGFTFQVLDVSTASKGRLLMTDDADVAIDKCTFIDMDSFIFSVGVNTVTIDDTTFRRCGLVTQDGATFDGCLFDEPSGPVGFEVTDLDVVDNCVFNSDGTGYAMELNASMAGNSYTMSGCSFVGYAGSDGDTGNECIYNNTGGTVTIGVGTGQIPTVHDVGISVTIITASVPLYIIVKDENGDPIQNVWVGIYKTSDRTEIKNQETDVNGEVDTGYTQSTPEEVEVRCRKASSLDDPRYKNYSSIQTIATTIGLSLAVTMIVDPNNNATT